MTLTNGNHATAQKNTDGDWICATCGGEAADFELFEDFGKLADCLENAPQIEATWYEEGEDKPLVSVGPSAEYMKAVEDLRVERGDPEAVYKAVMDDLNIIEKVTTDEPGITYAGATSDGDMMFKDANGNMFIVTSDGASIQPVDLKGPKGSEAKDATETRRATAEKVLAKKAKQTEAEGTFKRFLQKFNRGTR